MSGDLGWFRAVDGGDLVILALAFLISLAVIVGGLLDGHGQVQGRLYLVAMLAMVVSGTILAAEAL